MSAAWIQQKLPQIALSLIAVLIAYQAASLSWVLLPSEKSSSVWIQPAVDQKSDGNVASQNLFGKADAKQLKPVGKTNSDKAPKTKLDLTLVGIVAASDPTFSSAIIIYRGKQGSYFVGSKIDGASATISAIYSDHLTLDVNGSSQTLMLDGRKFTSKAEPVRKRRPEKALNNKRSIKLDRKAILKNPGKLTDYIRISPVRKDGEILGYRLRPGRDKTLFEEAGLKYGDIAIELNGVDLTDMQQAFTLMKAFPTMTELSLTVNREGQLHELYLSIPQ